MCLPYSMEEVHWANPDLHASPLLLLVSILASTRKKRCLECLANSQIADKNQVEQSRESES